MIKPVAETSLSSESAPRQQTLTQKLIKTDSLKSYDLVELDLDKNKHIV